MAQELNESKSIFVSSSECVFTQDLLSQGGYDGLAVKTSVEMLFGVQNNI